MGSRPVILVAEDESLIVDVYELLLSGRYELRVATSGTRAREYMDDSIDLFLLDRSIPDVSGDALLRDIRRRGYDCRVLMVSAFEPDDTVEELGYDAYLQKPFSNDELVETVARLLSDWE